VDGRNELVICGPHAVAPHVADTLPETLPRATHAPSDVTVSLLYVIQLFADTPKETVSVTFDFVNNSPLLFEKVFEIVVFIVSW
jgi:hypothetical protein